MDFFSQTETTHAQTERRHNPCHTKESAVNFYPYFLQTFTKRVRKKLYICTLNNNF